jgi:hypothetical protein
MIDAVAAPDQLVVMEAPSASPMPMPYNRAEFGRPVPAPDTHKGGFGHRLWDAIRLAGAVGQASGGSGAQMLRAFLGGMVKPEAYEAHKFRYEQMPEYYQGRERDIREQAALDQGQLRRIQIDNVITDNERADRAERRIGEEHASGMRIRQQQLDLNTQKALDDELDDWMMRNPGLPIPKELAERVKKPWLSGHTVPARIRASRDPNPVFKEAADGALYQLDRETGDWFPTTTKGGQVFRTGTAQERKITASDRAAAKVRAQNRVKQEYTGSHLGQLIKDYENGLYQTYAQEMGIDWKAEQAASSPPPADTKEPDYWKKYDFREHSIKLIQAARSRAKAEAKRIVERDLERLESQYLDEELEKLESSTQSGRSSREPSPVSRIPAQVPQRTQDQDVAEARAALNRKIAEINASNVSPERKQKAIAAAQAAFDRWLQQQ